MDSAINLAARFSRSFPLLTRLAAGVIGNPLRLLKNRDPEMTRVIIDLPAAKLALVNDLVTIDTVMADKQEVFPKSEDLELLLLPLIGSGVFAQPGGDPVRKMRKTYVKALAELSDEDVAAISRRTTERYLGTWRHSTAPVGIPSELSRLTIDVVAEATLGHCFSIEESRRFVELFFQYHKRANPLLLLLTSRKDTSRELLLARLRLKGLGEEMRDIIRGRFLQPLINADPNACSAPFARALLGSSLNEEGKNKPLADDPGRQAAILDEIAVMLLAGHETSSSVLSWLLWEIARMPEEQKEIRRLLQEDELSCVSTETRIGRRSPLASDHRLSALISESLRLYPPIAFLLRESKQMMKIGKRSVPERSFVVVSPWLIHRHGGRWQNPQSFMPSRWCAAEPPPAMQEKMAFIPFGQGPRVCPGKRFADVEMHAILVELIKNCCFSRTLGRKPKPLGKLTSRPDRDFRLRVTWH